MVCGQLPVGGCASPDLGHDGPCTPWPGDKPSRGFKALPADQQDRLLYEAAHPTGKEMTWTTS